MSIGPSELAAIDARQSVRLEQALLIAKTRVVPTSRDRRLQQDQINMEVLNAPATVQVGLAPLLPARATDPRPRNVSATKQEASTEKAEGTVAQVDRGVAGATTTVAHSGMVDMTSAALHRSGMVGMISVVHLLHSTGMVDTISAVPRQDISGTAAAVAPAPAGEDMVVTVGDMAGDMAAAPQPPWVRVELQGCHRKITRCGSVVQAANTVVVTMLALV
jgi:hypothetical protein